MRIQQKIFNSEGRWKTVHDNLKAGSLPQLLLVFGHNALISDKNITGQIRQTYPGSQLLFNSTKGEIAGTRVCEKSLALTGIHFENSFTLTVEIDLDDFQNSYQGGMALSAKLKNEMLRHVLILSECEKLNAAELINGMQDQLPKGVLISGALAGQDHFSEKKSGNKVTAVGFYGNIEINHGAACGWTAFGPERMITRSEGNVLYEIDHQPALEIYKKYLGCYADDLPASACLFPLSIRIGGWITKPVRTLLGINEKEQSLIFADEMPLGATVRMMTASVDKLVEGASEAALHSKKSGGKAPELALLFSCLGRKILLDQRVEEELEAVRDVYGSGTALAGFYSYGEISPSRFTSKSELNNQTMSITTFTEY